MQINPIISLSKLGGKAYQLSLLKEICQVPEFFAISFDNIEEINNIDIQNQILEYFIKNNFDLVSVRSSATVEDSLAASFAGMFDTLLNVDENNLINAIKEVVLSAKSHRVEEYCKIKEIEFSSINMHVVIQKMIKSRVSGVCFSRIKESKELMLIEACFGLGEALVSGTVTPDTYFVNRETYKIQNSTIGYQKIMLNSKEYEEVPFHKRNAKKLNDNEIEELAKVVLKIENNLNYKAVDVEWASEENNLYILQARPFTGA